MKISIDARILQFEKSGLYRVTETIIESIKDKHEVFLLFSNKELVPEYLLKDSKIKVFVFGPKYSILAWWWENVSLLRILKHINPDIYHAPINYGLPFFKINKIKYIITLHDMIPQAFPKACQLSSRIRWHVGVRIALRSADLIIANSEYTKRSIVEYFRIKKPDRIKVVEQFISDTFFNVKHSSESRKIDHPYIIYHGGFRLYKNVPKVIKSFSIFKRKNGTPHELIIVGSLDSNYKKYVAEAVKKYNDNGHIKLLGYISDNELANLLKYSDCHIFLSAIEGFGFPPLEALACGTSIICARSSCLPEILGDAASWVNENDNEDVIADQLFRVINEKGGHLNTDARNQILKKYKVEFFSNQMIKIYNECVIYY